MAARCMEDFFRKRSCIILSLHQNKAVSDSSFFFNYLPLTRLCEEFYAHYSFTVFITEENRVSVTILDKEVTKAKSLP